LKVSLTRTAKADVKAAAEWYEQQRDGLGLEFADCVLEAIDRISENPLAHRKVIGEARRCGLERFPYFMWFTVDANGSIVIACLHGRRNPSLAKARARSLLRETRALRLLDIELRADACP
jgi:plasmid stabilization system protein ParE